jgi:transposase-like protein
MQAAMAKKKRYSRAEIATKLARANDLATQGKRQSEIARALDVSVMTLHRWRKARDPIAQLPARKFIVAATGDRSAS